MFISLKEDMIDTTTDQGKAFLQMIGVFNEFWANIARERTEKLIERKKESGESWGRPKKLDDKQMNQVLEWHEKGLGSGTIANLIENGELELFQDIDNISRQTVWRYINEQ